MKVQNPFFKKMGRLFEDRLPVISSLLTGDSPKGYFSKRCSQELFILVGAWEDRETEVQLRSDAAARPYVYRWLHTVLCSAYHNLGGPVEA